MYTHYPPGPDTEARAPSVKKPTTLCGIVSDQRMSLEHVTCKNCKARIYANPQLANSIRARVGRGIENPLTTEIPLTKHEWLRR